MHEIENHSVIISQASLKKSLVKSEIDNFITELEKEEKKLTSKHTLLILDAEAVAGITHLKACVLFALKAFKEKRNIARKLNAEILLYLSGNRQISKAFPKAGITTLTKKVLMMHIVDPLIEKQKLKQFDFKSFLVRTNIENQDFKMDIDEIEVYNVERVLKNLAISSEVISLYTQGKSISSSDFDIIEKLAIEKSALLNLEK